MPIQIGKKAQSQDTAGALLECHDRIRSFCDVAVRLAAADPASPADDAREAAIRLHRYFTVSLPRHSADEDESITPRLEKANAPRAVLDCAHKVHEEHAIIDEVLARLIPAWSAMSSAKDPLAARPATLAADAARLKELFAAHLDLEERIFIPAIKQHLPPEADQEIQSEMKARRPLDERGPGMGGGLGQGRGQGGGGGGGGRRHG